MDCSPPGSSVHGILQARILESVAIPFFRRSSQSRDQPWVSCISGRFFTIWVTREDQMEGLEYSIWTIFSRSFFSKGRGQRNEAMTGKRCEFKGRECPMFASWGKLSCSDGKLITQERRTMQMWNLWVLWVPGTSLVAQMVKNLPTIEKTRVWSLGREDPLEKGMAIHSSILAWRIPWTEEPGRLQSMGLQRVAHDWVSNTHGYLKLDMLKIELCVLCRGWWLT